MSWPGGRHEEVGGGQKCRRGGRHKKADTRKRTGGQKCQHGGGHKEADNVADRQDMAVSKHKLDTRGEKEGARKQARTGQVYGSGGFEPTPVPAPISVV